MSDFQFQDMLPLGKDETPYRLVTKDHVSTIEAAGKTFLKVEPEGLTLLAREAMRDIALGEYRHWLDRERIAVNVDALYREFAGGGAPAKPLELWGVMAELAAG